MVKPAAAAAALLIGLLAAVIPVHGDLLSSQLAGDPDEGVEVADDPPPVFDPPPVLPDGLQAADMDMNAARAVAQPSIEDALTGIVEFWHKAAVRAHLSDYSKLMPPTEPGGEDEAEAPGVPGPAYTSRALAMVHLAIWDAYVGIDGSEDPYLQYNRLPRINPADQWVAIFFAVSRAAACTIFDVFTSQEPQLNEALAGSDIAFATAEAAFMDAGDVEAAASDDSSFSGSPSNLIRPIIQGIIWGERVCRAIIADRDDDGSGIGDIPVYTDVEVETPPKPYAHAPDPTVLEDFGFEQRNYARHWGDVRGFGINNMRSLTRLPPPPPPSGALDYPIDYLQVQCIGRQDAAECDPASGFQERTAKQLETGIFWAYDGAFKIGLPNRLYNDVMDAIVDKYVSDGGQLTSLARARLYAVANVVMADAAIAAWFEKYAYNFWRPVVGIRTDPEQTTEAGWRPYGSPETNMCNPENAGATRNPSFPAYPSGHATIGTGALAAIRDELGLDKSFSFSFQSAEFTSDARDGGCKTFRPDVTRTLKIQDAIDQNQDARTFIGVHWQFDSEQGGVLGEEVASRVLKAFPAKS